jgi:predicted  nucleic acid-binding Zn-ribbon protein
MARVQAYSKDTSLDVRDKLLGSSFISTSNGADVFQTGNFTLGDLAEFFANYQISDNQLYNFATISQQVTTNVSDIEANATYSLNLGASFGAVDDDGNLTSLSEAFANNLLSVATSEDYATATQLNSLTATVNNNIANISTNATDITSVTASTTQNTTDISTNTGNISTVTTTASANATAISTLQSDLSTANTSISQNATDITTLDSSVTTINTTITGIEGDITSNTTNITANASNITTLTNNLATTDANVTQNASDVTSLSTTVSTNTTNISNNGTNITSNTTNITTNASDISTLTNNLATANTNITQNASDVTSLTSTVSTNTTDIATAEGNITTNTTSISTNASDITTLTNNLATTDANVTQNATDVTSLTSTVNSNSSSIGTNTTNISTNASNITTLTNDLNTAEADITQNATNVTSLTSTVSSNTSSIGTNTTNISTNASNITTLTNDLNTAEADIVSNSSDITSLTTTVDGNTGDISTNASSISTLNAGLTTANNNISANASDITTVTATANTNTGDITTNASSISSLTTTVNGNTTSISTNATSINGIEGRYGVTIDSNGALTGFDLIGGGGASIFKINADDFKIYNSGGDLNPFSVSGGVVQVNGNLNVSGTASITGSSNTGQFIACDFKNSGSSGLSSIRVLNNSNYYGLFRLNTTVAGDIGYYGIDLVIGPATGGGEKKLVNFNGGGISMGLYGTKIFFNDGFAGNATSTAAGAIGVRGSSDGQATQAMFVTVPTNQAASTPAFAIETNASASIFKVFKTGHVEAASLTTSGAIRGASLTSDAGIAASGAIVTNSTVKGTQFIDHDNATYYLDPASTSNLNAVTLVGTFKGQNGYFTQDLGVGFNSGSIGGRINLRRSTVGIGIKNNYGTAGSGTQGIFGYTDAGMLTSGAYHLVFQADDGLGINGAASISNMLLCDLNGNLRNYNNSYGSTSDERLKENITDATPKLEDIKQLKVKNFNFIGNELKQIGLIAQEVEQIFPGLVEETIDPGPEGVVGDIPYKSIKYSVLVPMLIKAIQELEARVATLEG